MDKLKNPFLMKLNRDEGENLAENIIKELENEIEIIFEERTDFGLKKTLSLQP